MLSTFLLSSSLLSFSTIFSLPVWVTITGTIGCIFSANYYLDEILQKHNRKIFTNCHLINKNGDIPTFVNKTENDEKIDMIYNIPYGLSYADFKKQENSLSIAFKQPIKIKECNNYRVSFQITKKIIHKDFEPIKAKSYEILLGETLINMNKYPHCLIGGDTGSGKSRLLLSILTNLIYNNKNIDIHLLQIRKNDLGVFKNCRQIKSFATNLNEILLTLETANKELIRREKLIDNCKGIYNIEDYNKTKSKLNYIYMVVDEFSFLNISKADSKTDKLLKQQCLHYIKNIVSVGRSSGLFLITSLQKPTADSIPTDIKSQLTTRVSMRIQDIPTSIVILGTNEATTLQDRQLIIKTNKSIYNYTTNIEHNIIKKYITDNVIDVQKDIKTTPKMIKTNQKVNKNSKNPSDSNKISLL